MSYYDLYNPFNQEDNFYHNWLVTSAPPNSYSVEIGYVDTTQNDRPNTLSTDATYAYDEINWMDMPFRFTNFAQANLYAIKNYKPILFRITGSSDKPNYFHY